jgi:hypothetical protein
MMEQVGQHQIFKYSKSKMQQVAGTQTAGLAFGGILHSFTSATEEYNGSNLDKF